MWFQRFRADKPQVPLFDNGREEPQKGRNYIFNDDLVAAIDVALVVAVFVCFVGAAVATRRDVVVTVKAFGVTLTDLVAIDG